MVLVVAKEPTEPKIAKGVSNSGMDTGVGASLGVSYSLVFLLRGRLSVICSNG